MEAFEKIFLRDLLRNKNNLAEYVSDLYKGLGTDYTPHELNELFGSLRRQGYVNFFVADDSACEVVLTIKGKNVRESELRLSDKEELQYLSNRIDEIGKLFHPASGYLGGFNEIHDVNEFNEWKDEVTFILQKIYDKTSDKSIWRAINQFTIQLNGMNDENEVGQMFSSLRTIVKRIDDYFPDNLPNERSEAMTSEKNLKKYDVFISHASKDKLEYVEELYRTITKLGIKIFYDTETFEWGDNWKEKIYEGVESSEFAIIVISNNYFGREWTEKELNGFLNKQNSSGEKIILPLLHGISIDDLKNHYPELGDIQAISDEKFDVKDVAILFAQQLLKRYRENG